MKRQWYQTVINKIVQRCVRSRAGMTLTEMLAAVLILAMSAVAVAGGVAAVKNAYRKTTEKARRSRYLPLRWS
ncbi:prepilin-type N-terminal cleavage/methylation domain-containing protein [Clostridium sp. OF09-36]|uniref:prepilin-type N-terminal cleavage/methylation domain-containing protein n=1 Tax=Clostridium sp. OF09-36 TaxID=2292310 RepID=UPI000E4D9B22|nr:prepilin-type N-terminal cleavage/methylation domain-containing protein [Clostridium sp. OF09-36]RHV85613.1 prepilin-type N-terminal cleavage/methylation domain-containing protein [Clostridium sp. OF09-36]